MSLKTPAIKNILEKYRDLQINLSLLTRELGDNLTTIEIKEPVQVNCKHIINVLENYKMGVLNPMELLKWVNTIWFSDLYEYADGEDDSIASVMDELEELDEDDTKISEENIDRYLNTLKANKEI